MRLGFQIHTFKLELSCNTSPYFKSEVVKQRKTIETKKYKIFQENLV